MRALFEVGEGSPGYVSEPRITGVTVPVGESETELISALGVRGLDGAVADVSILVIGEREIEMNTLG